MPETSVRPNALVLYKGQPAIVRSGGEKLEIVLPDDRLVRVRLKDITPLHPGPVASFQELQSPEGDVETAWELLAGGTTVLAELAELVYGQVSPAAVWATWQLLDEGLHFHGTPQSITARAPAEVAQLLASRAARAAEDRAWATFMDSVRRGEASSDAAHERFLRELEDLAYGRTDKSRVLRELGRAQSPENAHVLLLELGYWDEFVDPHPYRVDVRLAPPAASLPPLPAETRLDLTHLTAFAIDDEGSTDPDDAISLEDGRLWVHVADVAAVVLPDSPADLEARDRGANLYLPEGTVPMLPETATAVLALGLAETSPALSFGIDVSDEGDIAGLTLAPSVVRVTRLTYEQAETQLDGTPLQELYELAQRREARRLALGGIAIDLPEVKIRISDRDIQIKPLPSLRSRNLVSEAMLLAGEAAARLAIQHHIPMPFTVQEPPDAPEEELPRGIAGMFALRRTLKRSQQSSVPGPHSGLGLDSYVRVTSPLRRYLDLVAHQQLRAHLRGSGILDTQALLERIGAAEAVTGNVGYAERLARQHWTIVYLMQRPHWRGEGVLVEVRGDRGIVLIPELAWEARVHLRGEIPLNSVVTVGIQGVNLPLLEAYFRLES
jgi:exoribonuclease-2